MLVCSIGAILILRTISERELCLFGDPSGEIPLCVVSLRPAGSSPKNVKNGVRHKVDYAAHYCAELLGHGLIEPMTTASELGDRRFRVSERGQALLLDLAKE